MAAPTLKQLATKPPPPLNKFQRAIDMGGAACLKEGSFPGDAWIAGLSVWGAEANWCKKWFDHQFANTKPQLVCHLSAGQKFYYCLTELEGLPQGAELFAEFSGQWQKQINQNAPALNPAGCNGQRNQPLNYATVDDFSICAPGQTQESGTAVAPSFAAPQSQEASLTPAAAAAIAAKEAEDAASKKAAAAAAAAEEAAKYCRALFFWEKKVAPNYSNRMPSDLTDFQKDRLLRGGTVNQTKLNELTGKTHVFVDMTKLGKLQWVQINANSPVKIGPTGSRLFSEISQFTTVQKHQTFLKFVPTDDFAPQFAAWEAAGATGSTCPADIADTSGGDDAATEQTMGGGAMLALAALALWAVKK